MLRYIALTLTSPAKMFLSDTETEESILIRSPESFRQFSNRYTSALIDARDIIQKHRHNLEEIRAKARDNDSTLKGKFYGIYPLSQQLATLLRQHHYGEGFVKQAAIEFRDGFDYPMANATLIADINNQLTPEDITP